MSGEKQTGAYQKRAGATARFGGLACGALLLAGLGGALPLAGQVTPPSAAVPGDWTWMSGSNSLGSGQGVPGVYGTLGTPNGTTNFPGGRWGAPNWIDSNGNFWLFGGYGFAGNTTPTFGYLNDLWEFNPSNNEWTWMGGAPTLGGNSCAEAPTYGSLGSFAPGNLPGGRQSAASWTDKNGNFWMFGGLGAGSGAPGSGGACGGAYNFGRLNDLWEFNPNLPNSATGINGEWAWMSGSNTTPSFSGPPGSYGTIGVYSPTNVPGGRQNASTWTDSSGNLWLFGGEGYDGTQPNQNFGELNDLWEFSPSVGTNGEWRWMGGSSTIPPYSGNPGVFVEPNQYPGSRYGAASWTDSSGNFWLFGGEGFDGAGNSGNLNDLWEFNPSTNIWAWISGSSTANQFGVYGMLGTPNGTANVPGGRYEASNWIDGSGNLWLSGGQGNGATSSGMLNDLWAFNPPTDQWVWMGGTGTPFLSGVYGTLQSPANSNNPGGRNQATSWTDIDGNLWLFGGDGRAAGSSPGALNDLWVYPPPTICWGPPSAIQISPATLHSGFPGESYFQNFTGTGGCGTGYVWSITSGAAALINLGISFSSGGDLSGYPNASGSYPFTVHVTDPQGNTGSQGYTLTIYPDIAAFPATLPAGTMGTPYTQTFTATGGSGGPYSFSVGSGTALSAAGLTLSNAGTISGTPGSTETAAAFTLRVTDSQGDFTQLNYTLTINAATSTPAQVTDNETITVSDTETFPDVVDAEKIAVADTEVVRAFNAIAITPSPASFNTSSGTGYATQVYSVPFAATGGIGTLTLTESGTLPTGVTFVNGVLQGTPAASSIGNTYTFSVTATDADGDSVTVPGYSLTILAASAYPAVVNDNETITVNDVETLPDVVDSELINVTDTETVRAYSPIAINPTPATFNASDGSAIAGAPYGPVPFTATGGTGTLTLTESGTLPAGLTFSNGSLGGTLSSASAGAYNFSVQAVDTYNDQTTVQGYTLNVAALPPSLTISASPVRLTIVQGQSGQTTITFTPVGGYSGLVTLSCSGLPANTVCVFTLNGATINSYSFPGNNQPVNVVLTINTDVGGTQARTQSAPTSPGRGAILTAIGFWCPGSLLAVIAIRRKRKLFTKNPGIFGLCVVVLLACALAGLAGCISGGGFGAYVTPVGTSNVTVVVTPGSGSAQTLSIGVTITKQ